MDVKFDILFFLNSTLLGVGLAMDAFSVSIADALAEPQMRGGRKAMIAGTFAGFQFLMPVVGWVCVHAAAQRFSRFQRYIPWIALLLLGYIGGKMLWEGIRERKGADAPDGEPMVQVASRRLSAGDLLLQGVATSIDALSVGFTIAEYGTGEALLAALVIAVVTFLIILGGLRLGRRAGERLAGKAGIVGGAILLFIGFEIFVRGLLGV